MGFGKDGRGAIVTEKRSASIGTLAADTGLLIGTKLAITKDFRMLRTEVLATMVAVTEGDMSGMALYLIDGELTSGEAEAAIEQNGPLNQHEDIENDIAERYTKLVGVVYGGEPAGSTERVMRDANTGGPVCIAKPRWTFGETESWQWMLYNAGAAPTTGGTIKIMTKNYGVWLS